MATEVKSSFFTETDLAYKEKSNDISDEYLEIINELNESISKFNLPTAVKCVYNPTIYARHTFEIYVRKYCNTKKKIMFFGMNPGPWGMSQTGVSSILTYFLFMQCVQGIHIDSILTKITGIS